VSHKIVIAFNKSLLNINENAVSMHNNSNYYSKPTYLIR
jgi:hypothetical protein